jgi:hypothetical protein
MCVCVWSVLQPGVTTLGRIQYIWKGRQHKHNNYISQYNQNNHIKQQCHKQLNSGNNVAPSRRAVWYVYTDVSKKPAAFTMVRCISTKQHGVTCHKTVCTSQWQSAYYSVHTKAKTVIRLLRMREPTWHHDCRLSATSRHFEYNWSGFEFRSTGMALRVTL